MRSSNLEGVTVILDAGHGGRDGGAIIEGVWESTYVYDIVMRVRRLLGQTAARTVMTTRDGKEWTVVDRDVLRASSGHAVLTTPPYAIADARVGSNLRWYLSNSVYGKAVTGGGDPNRVVFVSIHADSLHPSVRGAMVYVPGLLSNPSEYGKTGTVYSSRREVQERPRVDFAHAERARSEGLSRDLAGHTIDAMRRRGIAIHPQKPIRDRVIRGKRAWVPAVLRFNAVPAKVLVEVCNLGNGDRPPADPDPRFPRRDGALGGRGTARLLRRRLRRAGPPGRQQVSRLSRGSVPLRSALVGARFDSSDRFARRGNNRGGCPCLIQIDAHERVAGPQPLAPPRRDHDLADRHRYGDETAFREIYDRFSPMVYNLCLRLAGDPSRAQDLSQEVFLRVFKGLPRYRGGSSLKTWIYSIALNHCRGRLGRRGARARGAGRRALGAGSGGPGSRARRKTCWRERPGERITSGEPIRRTGSVA